MFWSLYNFMRFCSNSIGTQIVAWQKGNNTSYTGGGTVGDNRFDQPNYFGSNSFFVVRFSSASNPFEVLFQLRTLGYNGNSTNAAFNFGASPGNPGLLEGSVFQATTNPGNQFGDSLREDGIIGFAVAMRTDGTRSWNGTTASNGADTKGTPVWLTSSNSGTFLFPRNNNVIGAGVYGTNRENCMMLGTAVGGTNNVQTAPVRWHMYADENTFWIISDVSDDSTTQRFAYIGPYTPLSSANVCPPFLVCTDTLNAANQMISSARVYGFPIQGPTDNVNLNNGGVAHPSNVASGSMTLVFGSNNYLTIPSNVFGGPSKIYNYKYTVCVNDSAQAPGTSAYGICGTMEKFFFTVGPGNNDVSGSFAAFGGVTTALTHKIVLPWPTGVLPGISTTPFAGQQIAEIF